MKKNWKAALTLFSGALTGAAFVAYCTGNLVHNTICQTQKMSEKHLELYRLLLDWMQAKQEGKNISDYLKRNGYDKIAVYGVGDVGQLLIEELRKAGSEVLFGIDQYAESIRTDIQMFSVDDKLPEAEAVIVTPVTYYEEIKEKLEKKLECPIISLKALLGELAKD